MARLIYFIGLIVVRDGDLSLIRFVSNEEGAPMGYRLFRFDAPSG
jgi:hypothetical protein